MNSTATTSRSESPGRANHLHECMSRSGLLSKIGEDRFFRSVDEAVIVLGSKNQGS